MYLVLPHHMAWPRNIALCVCDCSDDVDGILSASPKEATSLEG